MTALALKEQILRHLHQGEWMAAQKVLNQAELNSPKDKIIQYNLQAKIFLYDGQYFKALPCLEASLVIAPGQLGVMVDLALCYYHLGLLVACENILFQSTQALQNELTALSPQEALDHGILLAKLFEEQGLIDKASETLNLISSLQLSASQEQALHIQLLRLATEVRDVKSATALYTQILKGQDRSLDFEVEREHTLLLADYFIFGFEQALERFRYLATKDLCPADQTFIGSEMMEIVILSGKLDFLTEHRMAEKSENEYERTQAQLVKYFIQNEKSPSLSVIRLEKSLSKMSLIRLLRQAILLFPMATERSQWILRYRFHCLQLTHKGLRTQFLAILVLYNSKVIVQFDNKVVSYSGKQSPLTSNLFWKLAQVFSDGTEEIGIDRIIETVYAEQPNDQHYDRLRIAVSRLNAQLRQSHNIEALFKLTKNYLTLLIPMEKSGS